MIPVDIKSGLYVVAVSGGVDSMVLLDIVARLPHVQIVAAHVNHGIRTDAAEDEELVRSVSMSRNIKYESISLDLGAYASEELARQKRYEFLHSIRKKYNARAILTAHHLDDVLETAIINMLRGTGWRGLSSLRSTAGLVRPFLTIPKETILAYARQHRVRWRYDSTNDDLRYLRNRVRHSLVEASSEAKEHLYEYIVRQNELVDHIDHEAAEWLDARMSWISPTVITLPRYDFLMIEPNVAHELLQSVLRRLCGKGLPQPLAYRALIWMRVAKPQKVFELNAHWQLRALSRQVIVEPRPTVVSLNNAGSDRANYLNKGYTHFETETAK